jgi:hypothetical protein
MIVCNACYGQVDSVHIPLWDSISTERITINGKDHQLTIGYNNGKAVDSMILRDYIDLKIDTIQVVLLVTSDTGPIAFKMDGYSVIEIHNEAEDTTDWWMDHDRPAEDYGVQLYYLDKNKQQLPENIIVWQSKIITP